MTKYLMTGRCPLVLKVNGKKKVFGGVSPGDDPRPDGLAFAEAPYEFEAEIDEKLEAFLVNTMAISIIPQGEQEAAPQAEPEPAMAESGDYEFTDSEE